MLMIDPPNGEGWIFQVAPMPSESFGHYIGRFRRANCLSPIALADLVSIDARLVRGWEMPSLGQPISAEQLRKLSVLLRLSEAQLTEMLPGARSQTYLATRLCPRCYGEVPIHRNDWQRAAVEQCDRHHEPLLTACPACCSGFRLPALWENGCCERCWLPFQQMHLFSPKLNQIG
jgi:hypothetical protein